MDRSSSGLLVPHAVTRRGLLGITATFTAWAALPRFARAEGRDPRLVVLVLRGAMDGLSTVAPVGDPDHERARGGPVLGSSEQAPGLALDSFFAMSPRLPALGALYQSGEALVVHAVASPYRERSHFDGQDVLESGLPAVGRADTGWLGRTLALLPEGEQVRLTNGEGFAAGAQVPLIMRGRSKVVSWMPAGYPEASEDTRARLLSLYRHAGDERLAMTLEEGLQLGMVAGSEKEAKAAARSAADADLKGRSRPAVQAARVAGRVLSKDDGPRIGTLDLSGFDNHSRGDPVEGQLGESLAVLDATIQALKESLGPVWRDTVVMVVTEFGRTVAFNGSGGTDHGTGTAMFLVGGGVAGGRVVADWPGLGQASLLEGRDLRPTTDLRSVAKGVLRDHLGVGERALAETVFPGTADLKPVSDLLRS
jgi:uncharacterized protein (DUF1501 family)